MEAPRTTYENIEEIIKQELGINNLDDVFTEFDREPIASASLAQVHKAKLRSTGEIVAVKVQHRWIREQIPGDIKLVLLGSNMAKTIFKDDYKFGWIADEFQKNLPKELDFRLEADNCIECKKMFIKTPEVHIPKIYTDYTRARVLVMSYEPGIPINQVQKMVKEGYNLRTVASLTSQAFTKMIFEDGFVHADPHPGNLLVRKDDKGDLQLVLLDHGIYTKLSKETRHAYTELWRALLSQNDAQLKEASNRLGCPFYELFASVIVQRRYVEIMDTKNKMQLKSRLGTAIPGCDNSEEADA